MTAFGTKRDILTRSINVRFWGKADITYQETGDDMEVGPRQHIKLTEMMADKSPLWDRCAQQSR